MTILLTGATGFIGHWIARQPDLASQRLRVLIRPGSASRLLEDLNVEPVEGDLRDRDSLDRALKGVRQVYHTAGVISFRSQDHALVREVNYQGAVNLFAATLAAHVEKVVYTASIFGLGPAVNGERPADESNPFTADDLLDIPYFRAKRDAEIAAQEFISQGLPLVRLYPGICFGPGDTNRSSTGAVDLWLRQGLPAVFSGGGICIIDVRDAAAAHSAAMQRGKIGKRYLVAGHNITLADLFGRLSAIAKQPPPIHLPAEIGLPLTQTLEKLGVTLPLESDQARLMARWWWYESSYAVNALKVAFRPLEETLIDTVVWLKNNPR